MAETIPCSLFPALTDNFYGLRLALAISKPYLGGGAIAW
ncbi:hypothetical protein SR1949_02200 [Sphaerospermopsis reniformis]|uniref:Uncharacterized protein n=1 Tax=Sphaerospermopsis reniformis TaxID=531300 RepID=A0A479ZV42_9CYAN|nr:hypothetical protein SR1949_02200 [Sphaerospermopsis reniformis]